MKSYKKGNYLFLELSDDVLEDYEGELTEIFANTAAMRKYHIVLNLQHAVFLSSVMLRLLLKYHKALQAQGKVLALLGPGDEITKYLAAAKLDTLLSIYPDEKALYQAVEHPADSPHPAHPVPFTFNSSVQGACVVSRLSGFIRDAAEMKAFEADIVNHVKLKRLRFVFNLEGLNFIDSCGIGRFIKLSHFLKSRGGQAFFCGANEVVADFFSALGQTGALHLCPTEADALAQANRD